MNTEETRKLLVEQMKRCREISIIMGMINEKYLENIEGEPAAVAAGLAARLAQEVDEALDVLETNLRWEEQQRRAQA